MKNKKLFLVALLALSVAVVSCNDDENEPDQICLPTELPGEDSKMKLTYDQNRVSQVEYLEEGNEVPGKYIMKLVYENDKISRTENYEDNVKEAYAEFEYGEDKIIETLYRLSSEEGVGFVNTERTIYYLEGGKIVKMGWRDLEYEAYDSMVFTYNANGNIIHLEKFNMEEELYFEADAEYDDKVSPYKASGITGGDRSFFDVDNLSNNNGVKFTYLQDGEVMDVETVAYTYDVNGNPLTRKFNWDDATQSFSYSCQ